MKNLKVYIPKPTLPSCLINLRMSVVGLLCLSFIYISIINLHKSIGFMDENVFNLFSICVLPVTILMMFMVLLFTINFILMFTLQTPRFKINKTGYAFAIVDSSFYLVTYSNYNKSNNGLVVNKNKFREVIDSICSYSSSTVKVTTVREDNVTGIYNCTKFEVVDYNNKCIVLNFPKSTDYLGDSLYDLVITNNFKEFKEVKDFLLSHDNGHFQDSDDYDDYEESSVYDGSSIDALLQEEQVQEDFY